MVDTTCIGRAFPPYTADVDVAGLQLFASATGETRPEYLTETAAHAAGHPSLPAPPTYLACLYARHAGAFGWMRELGIDVAKVLHAAQTFRYFESIHAGDRLTFVSRIANVLQKKNGTRTFVVKLTDVTNQHGARVAEMRVTIVVRGA